MGDEVVYNDLEQEKIIYEKARMMKVKESGQKYSSSGEKVSLVEDQESVFKHTVNGI